MTILYYVGFYHTLRITFGFIIRFRSAIPFICYGGLSLFVVHNWDVLVLQKWLGLGLALGARRLLHSQGLAIIIYTDSVEFY